MMKRFDNVAHELLAEQTRTWDVLARNAAYVASVESRTFEFEGPFRVVAQHNPARVGSVTAKVDPDSVRQRPCVLCDENRPAGQRSLGCGDLPYKLLCNPYPILPEHFTLVHGDHRPQLIGDVIGDMLALAQMMAPRYTVFYNGPECGASSPDHLHFQAGTRAFLPADDEYDRLKRPLATRDGVATFEAPPNYLRRMLGLESRDSQALAARFAEMSALYRDLQPGSLEPRMNVMCRFDEPTWKLIVFPRSKHRPAMYSANGPARMRISPGSVDISGIVVMPFVEDYSRVTSGHFIQAYAEVTLEPDRYMRLAAALSD